MPQLLGLLLLGLGMVLVALQNPAPLLPLVVLGQPVLVLPLGWWLAGAIGAGAVTMGLVGLLGRLGRSSRRPSVSPRAKPADRPAASPRQRILETNLGDESAPAAASAADEWEAGDERSGRSKSSRWRWLSLEAEPRPSVNAADLEEELSDWSAPDRPQKGWSYDPEWDEWDNTATQPATGRSAPVDRPRPANRVDRPFDRDDSPSDRPVRPVTPSPPAPTAKPIEAPVQPTASDRQGTVYSIRYQRDTVAATEQTPTPASPSNEPPLPDLPPPETRSRAVTDADYRVLIPPPPEDSAPPPRDRPAPGQPEPKDDWEDDW